MKPGCCSLAVSAIRKSTGEDIGNRMKGGDSKAGIVESGQAALANFINKR